MDKSNGNGVERENSFTLGIIGVAISGPEEATSGLAKLLRTVAQIAKCFEPSTVLWAFHTIQPSSLEPENDIK